MIKQNTRLFLRISEEDKQVIFDYCKKNNINNVSNFIRNLILNAINENKNKENK